MVFRYPATRETEHSGFKAWLIRIGSPSERKYSIKDLGAPVTSFRHISISEQTGSKPFHWSLDKLYYRDLGWNERVWVNGGIKMIKTLHWYKSWWMCTGYYSGWNQYASFLTWMLTRLSWRLWPSHLVLSFAAKRSRISWFFFFLVIHRNIYCNISILLENWWLEIFNVFVPINI